jgi:hypothetical protein
MKDDGWGSDHVGKLIRLQKAVRILAEGKGTMAQRLQIATYPLITLFPDDFPKHLRKRATKVLELRSKYVFHAGDESYLHRVKRQDSMNFIEDLLALYDACLIDLGRSWPEWDFMYPTDIEVKPRRSKRDARSKKGK